LIVEGFMFWYWKIMLVLMVPHSEEGTNSTPSISLHFDASQGSESSPSKKEKKDVTVPSLFSPLILAMNFPYWNVS